METEKTHVEIGLLMKKMYYFEWYDGDVWWEAYSDRATFDRISESYPVQKVKMLLLE